MCLLAQRAKAASVIVFTALALMGISDTVVAAQESVATKPILRRTVSLPSPWLSTLRLAATRGDSEYLGRVGAEFLQDLTKVLPAGQRNGCCDLAAHHYLLMFTTTDPQGKPLWHTCCCTGRARKYSPG